MLLFCECPGLRCALMLSVSRVCQKTQTPGHVSLSCLGAPLKKLCVCELVSACVGVCLC